MPKITTDRLRQWRENEEEFLLLNVLDEDAFQREHIPGSINVPLSSPDFTDAVFEHAEGADTIVVVYCSGVECSASGKAAAQLEQAGFSDVHHYEAGMTGWASAHLPTRTAV